MTEKTIVDIYYIDPAATPELKEDMRDLGIVEGMPFTIDKEFQPNSEINEFLWSLPTPSRRSKHSWKAYAQAISMYFRYLDAIGVNWKNAKKETLISYHRIRRHPVDNDLNPVSPLTWKTDLTAIKYLYEWALENDIIDRLPFSLKESTFNDGFAAFHITSTGLEERARKKDIKFIHIDDFNNKLLPALRSSRNGVRNSALCLLLVSTGLRIDEARNLKLSLLPFPDAPQHAGRKTCVLSIVGKGEKRRTIRIPKHVLRELYHYIDNERMDAVERYRKANKRKKHAPDYLFLSESGTPISIRAMQKVIKEAGQKAGTQTHPHVFRHSFAIFQLSAMIRATIENKGIELSSDMQRYRTIFHDPLRELQKLMGHSNVSTTFIYLDYLSEIDELVDKAAEDWENVLLSSMKEMD